MIARAALVRTFVCNLVPSTQYLMPRPLPLHHHNGQRDLFAVRQRERDGGDSQVAGAFGCAAGEFEAGLAAGFPRHFEFEPVDPVADSGAEGLRSGLFGGEAGCEAFGGVFLALAVGDLARSVDAAQEAVAKPGDALRDACDLHQVGPYANNHRLLSWIRPSWYLWRGKFFPVFRLRPGRARGNSEAPPPVSASI